MGLLGSSQEEVVKLARECLRLQGLRFARCCDLSAQSRPAPTHHALHGCERPRSRGDRHMATDPSLSSGADTLAPRASSSPATSLRGLWDPAAASGSEGQEGLDSPLRPPRVQVRLTGAANSGPPAEIPSAVSTAPIEPVAQQPRPAGVAAAPAKGLASRSECSVPSK